MPTKTTNQLIMCFFLGSAGLLNACNGLTVEEAKPYVTEQEDRIRQQSGTVHGNDKGFVIYSDREGGDESDDQASSPTKSSEGEGSTVSGLAVANPYLWQASLESLDFLPLAQADSGGGVIISDWYAPPETPDERFKVTVYILDQALRADALKVAVFRQTNGKVGWVDAEVDKATATGLEDNILRRAQELRLANGGS
ncbi:MAG: DUF3576 domain-containing protein [Geminicoccaceae bacterium]